MKSLQMLFAFCYNRQSGTAKNLIRVFLVLIFNVFVSGYDSFNQLVANNIFIV